MNHKSVDILLMVVITIIVTTLALTVAPDNLPGRILTLPLVLVLPGYALTSAVFSRRVLGVPERLLFSLGLSLVIVILVGLVLSWTPLGLGSSSWSVLLSSVTLGASAVALIRRRGQSISISGWGRRNVGISFRQGLLLGLAAIVVSGAVVVSLIGAERQSFSGFTQLWILPAGAANPKNVIHLGVSNMELTAMEYRLDVNMDGTVVKVWPSIDLKQNEKWEATLMLPQTTQVGSVRVEALLYRTDAPTKVYRHVVLWLGT